jgi:predicted ATPase
MHILMAGQGEGKTTQLMDWVKAGVQVSGYPGWSRVAVVTDHQRHNQMRDHYWGELEDFDHRVYTLHDIQTGHFTSPDTAYRLDDLDAFLPMLLPGLHIDGFTVTASEWKA